ncbi:hypothetical protein R5R35_014079 [Gryllus longicercus]|uniref:G-protein coupled receptors family 1 profile domain-containing protein n=1 Tax=Gryllus longicercus TaxID=2509291 RepID=A0AAN9WBM9_9ORTH
MVFVYIRIYFAAKARARRGIRKPPRRPPDDKCTSFSTKAGGVPVPGAAGAAGAGAGAGGTGGGVDRNSNSPLRNVVVEGGVTLEHGGIATIVTAEPPRPVAIPIVTCDFASDISTSDNAECVGENGGSGDAGYLSAPKDTLKVISGPGLPVKHPLAQCQFRGSTLSVNGDLAQQAAAAARCRAPSVGIDADMVSEFDPSSSDSGVVSRCAVVKPLKLRLCQPIFGRRAASKAKRSGGGGGRGGGGGGGKGGGGGGGGDGGGAGAETPVSASGGGDVGSGAGGDVATPRVQKPRDPEREKRRIARKKEKRATLILGLIMGSFIACWLPFFFLYILTPLCGVACDIPDRAFAIAFWLGYMNSALNPVIYTIFNKDFRRAFRRILFK